MKDFEAYSIGFVCASICTSLPIEEAVKRMNDEHPAGTMNGWMLSKDTNFRQGKPNPCPCEDHPETHKHYLLNC
jgi:hypothetical protein